MTRQELISMCGSEEAANNAIDAILSVIKPGFVESAVKLYGSKKKGKRFTPGMGEKYRHTSGGNVFKCVGFDETDPILQNVVSCWTFVAHDLVRHNDNTIEWGYSTGGHFEERRTCL